MPTVAAIMGCRDVIKRSHFLSVTMYGLALMRKKCA
jgi:hypothetical protein